MPVVGAGGVGAGDDGAEVESEAFPPHPEMISEAKRRESRREIRRGLVLAEELIGVALWPSGSGNQDLALSREEDAHLNFDAREPPEGKLLLDEDAVMSEETGRQKKSAKSTGFLALSL